jgi:hypothetical protein
VGGKWVEFTEVMYALRDEHYIVASQHNSIAQKYIVHEVAYRMGQPRRRSID